MARSMLQTTIALLVNSSNESGVVTTTGMRGFIEWHAARLNFANYPRVFLVEV